MLPCLDVMWRLLSILCYFSKWAQLVHGYYIKVTEARDLTWNNITEYLTCLSQNKLCRQFL